MRHWGGPRFRGEAGEADRRGYHHGNLKEALVEAARRFIAERGLSGFTLVDAARWVGVTPAALYRHFRGREALVAEVAFRGYGLLAERLGRSLSGAGTPLERFTRMGEAYLDFAEKEPGYYTAMFSAASGLEERGPACGATGPWGAKGPGGMPPGATPPEGAPQAARPPGAFDLLVEALERTFPDGFGAVDPRFLALGVWALSHGIATLDAAGQLPRGPGLPDKRELLRAGVLAIVHGALPAEKR